MFTSSLFNYTRPNKKKVSRARQDSLHWKYYILHRNLESKFEELYLKFAGYYGNEQPVSFVTTVMDRFDHLEKTFISNIHDNKTAKQCEFVLLNYNCPDERTDKWVKNHLMTYIAAGRVNYYKYQDDTGSYRASHARNLAFRVAQNSLICNVDVDNYLGSDFYAYISAVFMQDNIFLRGPVDRRGVAGRLCCYKTDWEAVGGYDERFSNWGVEDSDLDSRLTLYGLQRKTILPEKYCRCILHEDELRSRHYEIDTRESYMHNKAIENKNRESRTINPNGDNFGRGRMQKNFTETLEL